MVKVKLPCISFDASGRFGKAVIFQRGKKCSYVRMLSKPVFKFSYLQGFNKLYYGQCVADWRIASQDFKDSFIPIAQRQQIEVWNAFFSWWFVYIYSSVFLEARFGFSYFGG